MRFVFLLQVVCLLSTTTAFAINSSDAEGLFEIQMICEDRTNPACTELNRKARLTLIRTDEVLAASIGYPEVSIARYSFISNELELTGSRYVGEQMVTSSSAAQFAEVSMDFVKTEEAGKPKLTVKGIIRDARFIKDVEFFGEQTVSLNNQKVENSDLPPLISSEHAEGRFLAKGKDRQWSITIRKTLSNSSEGIDYLAETTDLGSPDGTELASGERRYLRSIRTNKTGYLEFVAPLHTPGTFLKWALWANPDSSRPEQKFQGFFFSSTGVFSHLSVEAL